MRAESSNMSISVNGHSQVPPGFRFHPTEEELLHYYLKKKVSYEKIDLDVIRDVDLNKLEPWDIQEKCKVGTTPQNDWYFFSHKDKKYPTGTRTNRATAAGFWKATGRDKVIYSNGRRIGMRKTLVFYKGRAPHGQKSDWIMHEYRLDDNTTDDHNMGEAAQEEGWVVCRIFKKKNHHKTLDRPLCSSITAFNACNNDDGDLDQILQCIGRTSSNCKEETESSARFLRPIETSFNHNGGGGGGGSSSSAAYQYERFMKLPSLDSPNSTGSSQNCYQPMIGDNDGSITNQVSCSTDISGSLYNFPMESGLTNWAALDRLVASQLNGQTETCRPYGLNDVAPTVGYSMNPTDHLQLRSSFSLPSSRYANNQDHYNSEIELWNFTSSSTRSSSDPLGHVSDSSV